MDIQCEICKLVFKSKHKFYAHLTTHDISKLDYWRKYIVHDDTAGNCLVCGKLLNLNRFNLFRGFNVKVHSGKCNACTKETFLLKYGNDGERRWQEYCKRQAETNTFAYKEKMYGYDKAQFDMYNKSRAVTLNNMINKYGDESGRDKFQSYVEKQRDAGCSLKYFVETYGVIDGPAMYAELNKKKANTLDNFIKRHGEDGLLLYENYLDRIQHNCYISKAATEFFTELAKTYVPIRNLYFGEKEFGLMHKDIDGKAEYFKYDFVDTQKKKIIEYNGDYWHAKSENDPEWLPEKHRGITAAESFNHDRKKKLCALQNGYKIFYIWEHEVKQNFQDAINKCKSFLQEE